MGKPPCSVSGRFCCRAPRAPITPSVHVPTAAWSCASQPVWLSVGALVGPYAQTTTNPMSLGTKISTHAVSGHAVWRLSICLTLTHPVFSIRTIDFINCSSHFSGRHWGRAGGCVLVNNHIPDHPQNIVISDRLPW